MSTVRCFRCCLVAGTVAAGLWLPITILEGEAAGIPEVMQPESSQVAPSHGQSGTVASPDGWVDEIRQSVHRHQSDDPASNLIPYLTRLDLVQDAVERQDRRAVKTQMGAFLRMLSNRDHGISDSAAEDLSILARQKTPPEAATRDRRSEGVQ